VRKLNSERIAYEERANSMIAQMNEQMQLLQSAAMTRIEALEQDLMEERKQKETVQAKLCAAEKDRDRERSASKMHNHNPNRSYESLSLSLEQKRREDMDSSSLSVSNLVISPGFNANVDIGRERHRRRTIMRGSAANSSIDLIGDDIDLDLDLDGQLFLNGGDESENGGNIIECDDYHDGSTSSDTSNTSTQPGDDIETETEKEDADLLMHDCIPCNNT
jgi:hypothetical protein